ncbi:MAG: DUF1189 domain-containing protein [Clostridia bacterium]|nr:DUF1189 domain-containing protein [Clostridia bacterium]
MTEENGKKIGFFKRIYLSIKEFEQYGVFAAEKLSVSIKYLLGIMFVFVLVVAGIFMYQFHNSFQGAVSYFKDNIDEVYFSKGELEVNKGNKLEIQNDNSVLQYVLIHTDASEEEIKKYENKLNTFENGIIILKDKIIYKNEMLAQSMQYKYEDIIANYPITEFDKQGVIDLISNIDMVSLYISIFIVMFIYLYIIYLATTFVDVVMLGVLGYIIARIAGMKIRFKATFNIGVYALTLPILLNLIYIVVNTLTGFEIRYFNWMYTTISYIYVIVAIFMIRADFINKQAELMRIIEEQEKVRQEMIEKEEQRKKEEEKNENKDNKDDEKEPKEEKTRGKKKEEKPLNDDGLAPQEIE